MHKRIFSPDIIWFMIHMTLIRCFAFAVILPRTLSFLPLSCSRHLENEILYFIITHVGYCDSSTTFYFCSSSLYPSIPSNPQFDSLPHCSWTDFLSLYPSDSSFASSRIRSSSKRNASSIGDKSIRLDGLRAVNVVKGSSTRIDGAIATHCRNNARKASGASDPFDRSISGTLAITPSIRKREKEVQGMSNCLAIASIQKVFPVPGGPESRRLLLVYRSIKEAKQTK